MKLDLKKFKKIDFDDKQTLLEHDDGHHLKIAHKGLSKEYRQELDKMPVHKAKGGFAKWSQKYDPNFKKVAGSKASQPSQPSKPQDPSAYTEPKQAKHSYTEPDNQNSGAPFDEDIVVKALNRKAPPFGPMGAEKPMYPPCINPSCKSYGRSHPNCRCYGGNEHVNAKFAKGGEVESYCSKDRKHQQGCEYYAEGTTDAPVGEEIPELQPPELLKNEPQPQEPAQEPAPEIDKNSIDAPNGPTEMPMVDVPQQSPDQKQPVDPYSQYQQKLFDVNQFLHDQSQKFYSDVDAGHIEPKTMATLFHDKELPAKIGTLFGMIIGGAGSGLAHQDNALLGMMQKQIQNDLAAQEQNQGNRRSLMQINGQNLMQMANAGKIGMDIRQMQIEQSRDQANYYLYNQLAQKAMDLSNPQQAQKAAQTLSIMKAGMDADKASAFAKAAGANSLGSMLRGGGNTTAMKTGLYGPEIKEYGEDVESKTIPGIGQAKLPVPQHVRDQVQAMKVLSDKAADVIKFSRQNVGTLDPRKRAVAQQKASELVNFYSSSLGGALTGYRLNWLDEQIKKNPQGVAAQLLGNNQRLQEIKDSNDKRMNTMLQQYGAPTVGEKSNPEAETKQMHGATYKKVNGGWSKVK